MICTACGHGLPRFTCLFDFKFWRWQDHKAHNSHFIETYLVDNSDRDRSESPWKSMVGDHRLSMGRQKRYGSRKWKSPGSNHLPFSMYACCRYSAISFTHDNRTHHTPNRREDVWRQKLALHYGKMAAVFIMRMRTRSYYHHKAHNSHFIETYLVDNSDRDRSESPWKSMVGDHRLSMGRQKRYGSRKWKSPGSNHLPFSMYACCRYSAISFTHDNRTHHTPNRREDVWRQKLALHYGKMAAVFIMRMRTRSYYHIIALIKVNGYPSTGSKV